MQKTYVFSPRALARIRIRVFAGAPQFQFFFQHATPLLGPSPVLRIRDLRSVLLQVQAGRIRARNAGNQTWIRSTLGAAPRTPYSQPYSRIQSPGPFLMSARAPWVGAPYSVFAAVFPYSVPGPLGAAPRTPYSQPYSRIQSVYVEGCESVVSVTLLNFHMYFPPARPSTDSHLG